MASYSIQAIGEPPYSKNRLLTGTTADAVIVLSADVSDLVEVLNRSSANYIGVNPNGATAVQSNTSTSDGTIYVAPGQAIRFNAGSIIPTAGANVVSIVGNADQYSITVIPVGSVG